MPTPKQLTSQEMEDKAIALYASAYDAILDAINLEWGIIFGRDEYELGAYLQRKERVISSIESLPMNRPFTKQNAENDYRQAGDYQAYTETEPNE